MNTPSTNLTILHDTQEWSTDIEGEIGEIRVDGRRLDDIHDLSQKVRQSNMYIVEVTKRIKTMAYIATALAVMAVAFTGYIGGWLARNHEQISETMDTTGSRFSQRIIQIQKTNGTYAQKLTELGWRWEDGKWQQIVNTAPNASK